MAASPDPFVAAGNRILAPASISLGQPSPVNEGCPDSFEWHRRGCRISSARRHFSWRTRSIAGPYGTFRNRAKEAETTARLTGKMSSEKIWSTGFSVTTAVPVPRLRTPPQCSRRMPAPPLTTFAIVYCSILKTRSQHLRMPITGTLSAPRRPVRCVSPSLCPNRKLGVADIPNR